MEGMNSSGIYGDRRRETWPASKKIELVRRSCACNQTSRLVAQSDVCPRPKATKMQPPATAPASSHQVLLPLCCPTD